MKIALRTALIVALLGVSSAFALTVAEITDVTPKVDEKPVPIRTTAPTYPPQLKDAGVSGIVSVVIVVGESGDVIASEVSKSTREEFNAPALEAVKTWRFKPATVAGKPVKVRVTLPIRFSIGE